MKLNSGARWMVLAVLYFAVTHASVKALPHIPFFELVVFRAIITLGLCLHALRRLNVPVWGNNKPLLIARGVFGTVALTLYFYTLQHMPLASAVTIQYIAPLLTILLAGYVVGEKARPRQWIFFLIAFAGVVMVKGFDPRVSLFDLLVGVGAAAASAVAYNIVRLAKDTDHEMVVVFYFPLVTLPLVGPFAVSSWVWPRGWDWLVILTIGVFTQLAQLNMTRAYQAEPAAKVSIYNYLGVILAIAIGKTIFDEDLSALSYLGIAVIFTAVGLNTFWVEPAKKSGPA